MFNGSLIYFRQYLGVGYSGMLKTIWINNHELTEKKLQLLNSPFLRGDPDRERGVKSSKLRNRNYELQLALFAF